MIKKRTVHVGGAGGGVGGGVVVEEDFFFLIQAYHHQLSHTLYSLKEKNSHLETTRTTLSGAFWWSHHSLSLVSIPDHHIFSPSPLSTTTGAECVLPTLTHTHIHRAQKYKRTF